MFHRSTRSYEHHEYACTQAPLEEFFIRNGYGRVLSILQGGVAFGGLYNLASNSPMRCVAVRLAGSFFLLSGLAFLACSLATGLHLVVK